MKQSFCFKFTCIYICCDDFVWCVPAKRWWLDERNLYGFKMEA